MISEILRGLRRIAVFSFLQVRWVGEQVVRGVYQTSIFSRDVFRAHFNLFAQYLSPIEQELLGTNPPLIKNLNGIGQLILSPLIFASYAAALTAAPVLYNFYFGFKLTFAPSLNTALLDLPANQHVSFSQKSLPWYRIIPYSFPGMLLGLGFGGIAAIGVLSLRTLSNSFKSLYRVYVSLINPLLTAFEHDAIVLSVDERNQFQKTMGLFGIIPGLFLSAFGALALVSEATSRYLAEGVWVGFATMTNLALIDLENQQLTASMKQGHIVKQVIRTLGVSLGGALGLMSASLVGIARIIGNSLITGQRFFAQLTDAASIDLDDTFHLGLSADKRTLPQKILGMPGAIAGSLFGVLGFSVVGLYRVTGNSILNGWREFALITNFALFDLAEHQINVLEKPRSILQNILGLPGSVLGIMAGMSGFQVVIAARLLQHSVINARISWAKMVNIALHDIKVNQIQLTEDTRHDFFKFIGFPGTVAGYLIGIPSIVLVGAGRVFGNTFITTIRESYKVVAFAFLDMEKNPIRPYGVDTRTYLQKSMGALGFPIAYGIGSAGFVIAILARIAYNSVITGQRQSMSIVNLALLDLSTEKNPLADDTRNLLEKTMGFPGHVGGAVVGFVAFSLVIVGRTVYNSLISGGYGFIYAANLSLDDSPLFKKISLQQDKRNTFQKYIFGGVGVLVGASMGASVAVVIFSVRQIPTGVGIILSVAGAPFVPFLKWANMLINPRFSKNEVEEPQIQAFKNIYSSIDTWGHLPKKEHIHETQNGGKGVGRFIHKSVTLNISTLDESVLDMLLASYKKNKAAFFSDHSTMISELKQSYRRTDFFESEQSILERDARIDEVDQMVSDYLGYR